MIMEFINRKTFWVGGITATVLLATGVFYAQGAFSNKDNSGATVQTSDAVSISIETVGSNHTMESGTLGISWPGEIASLGDVEVQPQREGTITEWKINIGQKVFKGQILGRLSAPPAIPELVSMLAEQAKMLAEARFDSDAQIEFTKKKTQQLTALLEAVDRAKADNLSALDSTATVTSTSSAADAIRQAKYKVATNEQRVRVELEQAINRELRLMSNNSIDAVSYYKKYRTLIFIKTPLGELSPSFRSSFQKAFDGVLDELVKENGNLEIVGPSYFDAVIKMVAASYTSDELTSDQLSELRTMTAMDQTTFLEAVRDYQMSKTELIEMKTEYRLTLTEKQTDYAMQRKEIEEQIAMLEKDVAMNMGRVEAAGASYKTVSDSIKGGLSIISPADGVISSVMKKTGDFVEPGMAIASLNTGRKEDRFIRFYIPSNLAMLEPGTELTIMRPGFANDAKKIKLIGTGTALNDNGSYVADAKFIDQIDWPVRASVRVLPPLGFVSNISVALAAVWWDDKAQANVWLVTEENRIRPQQIKIGRTLGDRLEIMEGLQLGNQYVLKALPELITGQKLTDIKIEDEKNPGDGTESDDKQPAHGHDE